MTRIATAAQNSVLLGHLMDTQRRVADAQVSISSGVVARRYAEIAPDASRLVSLEGQHVRADGFLKSNKVVGQRLAAMEARLNDIFNVAKDLKADLVGALNVSGADRGAVAIRAQGLLQEVAGSLNTQIDGRYLFAGARSDTRPVDLNAAGFAIPPFAYPSTANTAYYKGDQTKLSVLADEDVTITYGMTADDPAFEKIIRALHLTGTAGAGQNLDYARGTEALAVVDQGLEELTNLMAKIGGARQTLESVNGRHDDYLVYLNQSIAEIEATDVPKTMTLLSQDTVALQASYSVLARLANLSLADYLR